MCVCVCGVCGVCVCGLALADRGGGAGAAVGSLLFPCLSATELNATSFPIPRSAATK